jgi:hypothetical protein
MATKPLDPTQAGAAAIIKSYLDAWGISDLYKDALALIKQGLNDDAILVQLESTDTYKKRFSANEDRKKKGLSVLSPAEYIAAENSYKQVLRSYGLPAGFYDSNDDVKQFLANDVSPSELSARAQNAQKIWLTGNPDYRSVWKDFYGLSDGDAIAAMLDPNTALPLIDQKVTATQIGAAARRQGIAVNADRAGQLGGLGVDEQTALKGYGAIAANQATDQSIAQRFGDQFDITDEENDQLLGLASAQRKRRRLYGAETGLFSEQAGSDKGAFSRPTAGRY